MPEELYNSHYLGIVIQNNDPQKRGRVKVFVPAVNKTVYENWDALVKDKKFIFLDKETNPDLDLILPKLKQDLPWAEIAMPMFGGSASGRYNAFTKHGTVSDSNHWEGDSYSEGFRPLQNFTAENRVSDAFANNNRDTGLNRFTNPHGTIYSPSNYSNLARGLFTLPNVGAHVWVFFQDGDPQYPVVWSISYGVEDWKRIYSMNTDSDEKREDFTSFDYPESYENLSNEELSEVAEGDNVIDHNIKTFRAKHVFNSNKHSLEFIDTDKKEIVKLTHFSGSFKEFNNFTNSELAVNNDQKLVIGDQFFTVKKNQSIFVAQTQDNIIFGDRYLTIGDYIKKQQATEKIKEIIEETHQYKLLFEIMRTALEAEDPRNSYDNAAYVSELQKKDGEPDVCPVCQGSSEKLGAPCYTCGGSGVSPSTQDGIWADEKLKWDPVGKEWKWYSSKTKSWDKIGGEVVWDNGILMWKNTGNGYQDDFNTESYNPPSDWSPHFPDAEDTEDPEIVNIIRENQRKILDFEAEYGEGGDSLETIAGSKVTTIGTTFNDLLSFRRDPIGKIRDNGVYVAPEGTYTHMETAPVIEYVDVDKLPGGDWNVTVGNRYTLNVGSKGINIRTTGPLDLHGTIVNFTGEQVNIGSQNEVVIDGGERLDLRGKIISLSPNYSKNERHVILADGNLGVRDNLTVTGSTHLEGELHFLHLTSVEKWSPTTAASGCGSHVHFYRHPPWELLPDCIMVRERAMAKCNGGSPTPNNECPGFWVPGMAAAVTGGGGGSSGGGGGSSEGGSGGNIFRTVSNVSGRVASIFKGTPIGNVARVVNTAARIGGFISKLF
jgi:hypothetical protein